jgi:hypothetical protein
MNLLLTDFVKPICMVRGEQMTKQFTGETSEVAGWGIYDVGMSNLVL